MDTKLRVIVNALYNASGWVVTAIVGLYLIPFMLDRLGKDPFSIIILIISTILPFLEIITTGVLTSVGRYVTFHHARQEIDEANKYFNTSFFAVLGLCVIAVLPILAISYYFPSIFDVPRGWESSSRWTMLLAGVAFILTAVSGPFGVGMYYRQRFGLRNAYIVLAALTRLGVIVLLFSLFAPSTVYASIGLIVAAAVQGLASIVTAYRMLPGLRVSWRFFSREKLKDVFSFSFFVVISRVSVLLFVGTDYILINLLLSKGDVTVYYLGARWAQQMKGLAAAAVFVLGPLVTILDATDHLDRVRTIFLRGVRVMLLIICPATIFFCALGIPFMNAWVGKAYFASVAVLWVMVLPSVLNVSVVPAFTMFTALGRVRAVAFVTLAAGVVNVGLSIWLAVGLHMGILGMAIGSSVCLIAKNAAFVPWYMSRLCGATIRNFYSLFPRPIAACLPGAIFAILIQLLVDINSWPAIILVGIGCLLSYLLIIYFWGLSDKEKVELSEVWSQLRRTFAREQPETHE